MPLRSPGRLFSLRLCGRVIERERLSDPRNARERRAEASELLAASEAEYIDRRSGE